MTSSRQTRQLLGVLAAPFVALISITANALEYQGVVGYEAEYSDNIRRSTDNEEDDIVHRPTAGLSLSQQGTELEANLEYTFVRRIYQDNTFDDDTVSEGEVDLTWHAVEDRLDVSLRNVTTQSTLNAEDQNTADNQQLVNVFEISPRVFYKLRGADELSLSYRFTDFKPEDSDNENQRHGIQLGYLIPQAGTSTLRIEADALDVSYDDNDNNPDLRQYTAAMTYDTDTTSRFGIRTRAGVTKVNRDGPLDDTDGFIGSIDLDYQLSRKSQISLQLSRDVSDLSTNLQTGIPRFGESVVDNSDESDVATRDTVSASYDRDVGGGTVRVRGGWGNVEYEDVDRDEERYDIGATLDLPLSARATFRLFGQYRNISFSATDREDDEISALLSLRYLVGRSFLINASAAWNDRDSNDATTEFDEARVSLGIGYRFPRGTNLSRFNF